MERTPRFAIGHRFKMRGRRSGRFWTVTDILRTYNSKGELVRLRYVAETELTGQIITDHDVAETTIAMGGPA